MTGIGSLRSGRFLLLTAAMVLEWTQPAAVFPDEELTATPDRTVAEQTNVVATSAEGRQQNPEEAVRGNTVVASESPQARQSKKSSQSSSRKSQTRGKKKLKASAGVGQVFTKRSKQNRPVVVHLNLGREPDDGRFNGVIGGPEDSWNFLDVGQTGLQSLKLASGQTSPIDVEISDNDGEWGIPGHMGVYHAYLYHNCRCVDLSLTFHKLPPGLYDVYVFAHGDAPDQNAAVEIQSGAVKLTGKSTLNDGTWNFRSRKYEDGNQFVRYLVEVTETAPLVITSRRDGSHLSMFNAVQLERVLER